MDQSEHEVSMSAEWRTLLADEFQKPYFVGLRSRVREAYLHGKVYPPPTQVFRALDLVAPRDVRVVILGQDPYHTPGVADGLAFSSLPGNPIPPSLKNIFKEIESEFGVTCPNTPVLTEWASQGVLLLNTSFTVAQGEANSHAEYGWGEFTDAIITALCRTQEHIVFLLWGNNARAKKLLIDTQKHLVLESAHPSPLSAYKGFLGNGHFKKANAYLQLHGRGPINWCGM